VRLYLVRHAWAESRDDARWPDDRRRPLTKEGRKRFRRMIRLLAKRGVRPQWIAASPYARCRESAQIWIKQLRDCRPLSLCDALAPEGKLSEVIQFTEQQGAGLEHVAWVGHTPELRDFLAVLIQAPPDRLHLAKGAIACVEFDGPIREGAGRLLWIVEADLVGA